MFHRCPAKRHTQSNDPSNGTFVASNVRNHECAPPSGGDHGSPSFARGVFRISRKSLYIREVYKPFDLLASRHTGFRKLSATPVSETQAFHASRKPLHSYELYKFFWQNIPIPYIIPKTRRRSARKGPESGGKSPPTAVSRLPPRGSAGVAARGRGFPEGSSQVRITP